LLLGNGDYWKLAEQSTAAVSKLMSEYPSGFGQWLNVASFLVSDPVEIALVGTLEELAPMLDVARHRYRPFQVIALGEGRADASVPLLRHRSQIDDKGTAYVCRHFSCQAPVTDPQELASQLGLD